MHKAIGLIPTRLNSRRLPRKSLKMIGKLPLIIHTYRRVKLSKKLDEAFICCDSKEVFNVAKEYNANVILTSKKHKCGTDRIYEAFKKQNKNYEQIINIQGDEPLIDPKNIDKTSIELWNKEIQNWRETHGLNHDLLDKKFHQKQILPQQVIQSLYKSTNGKAFITSDVGQHQMFAAQYYKFDEPRKWINSGGLGTMGFGLPSAMGVKFAYPDEDVVCVTGEGSIQMCIQELSTCMQYGLPVKIINLNNRALGMVKQWQDMQYGGRYSSILYEDSLPDFVKLAESYGHVGMKVEDISELEERMDECISMKDKLVFMDVYVDPEEHVYPMLEAGGNMSEMRVSKTKKTF